jgi:hypothetical protein
MELKHYCQKTFDNTFKNERMIKWRRKKQKLRKARIISKKED